MTHQQSTPQERLSGVPVLLNISFNLSGDPIVESPEQAVGTFLKNGLDTLAIGDYLVKIDDCYMCFRPSMIMNIKLMSLIFASVGC